MTEKLLIMYELLTLRNSGITFIRISNCLNQFLMHFVTGKWYVTTFIKISSCHQRCIKKIMENVFFNKANHVCMTNDIRINPNKQSTSIVTFFCIFLSGWKTVQNVRNRKSSSTRAPRIPNRWASLMVCCMEKLIDKFTWNCDIKTYDVFILCN